MPITEKTVMKTEVIYNDDRTHRYLLRKEWDKAKPKAAIIMLYPSNADTITVDHTTMFVLSNLERLGYELVASGIHSLINSVFKCVCTECHNRYDGVDFLYDTSSVETVHLWHSDVHKDKVRMLLLIHCDCLYTVY